MAEDLTDMGKVFPTILPGISVYSRGFFVCLFVELKLSDL